MKLVDDLKSDATVAIRLMLRNPGSTIAIVIVTIAIGPDTAVVGVVNALVVKPLPVSPPETLARVRAGQSLMSWPNFEDVA